MITAAIVGVVLIFLMAGLVGIHDWLRAPAWRQVAAERRLRWEDRRAQAATSRVGRRRGPVESV